MCLYITIRTIWNRKDAWGIGAMVARGSPKSVSAKPRLRVRVPCTSIFCQLVTHYMQ